MNKLTRTLTMGGLGLLAAIAGGAGAAQAATSNGASAAKPAPHHARLSDGVQIAGFYRTRTGCELAGQFGARSDDWDYYNCIPVRIGVRSGAWALQVASDDNWNQGGFVVPLRDVFGFPTRFRPHWPGQFGPGRPGPDFGHRGPRFDDRGPRGRDSQGPHFGQGPVGLGPSGVGSAAPVGAGTPTPNHTGTPGNTGTPNHTGTPGNTGTPGHIGVAPTGHQGN